MSEQLKHILTTLVPAYTTQQIDGPLIPRLLPIDYPRVWHNNSPHTMKVVIHAKKKGYVIRVSMLVGKRGKRALP